MNSADYCIRLSSHKGIDYSDTHLDVEFYAGWDIEDVRCLIRNINNVLRAQSYGAYEKAELILREKPLEGGE